jgi:hypothetical protein
VDVSFTIQGVTGKYRKEEKGLYVCWKEDLSSAHLHVEQFLFEIFDVRLQIGLRVQLGFAMPVITLKLEGKCISVGKYR